MLVHTVLVGLPQDVVDDRGPPWHSGFNKQPVEGRVVVTTDHLRGDGQAARTVHGGPDKAILAYCVEHYPRWNALLDRQDLGAGSFGENLALSGIDETTIAIGDQVRVGSVVIQVSQPRQPCWKLARRCRLPTMPAKAIATGWLGWYFRVLEPGTVAAGDRLEVLARPNPDWTIARINRLYFAAKAPQRAELATVMALPGVSPDFTSLCAKRLPGAAA
jgi:MOSC domain-containing protein YiiM